MNIPVTAAIAGGPKIALSPNSLTITSCGVPQTLTVKNTGDTPLNFTAMPSDAKLVNLSANRGSVNPNQSTPISVTIACTAPWAQYTITVTSNGGNGSVTIHYPS